MGMAEHLYTYLDEPPFSSYFDMKTRVQRFAPQPYYALVVNYDIPRLLEYSLSYWDMISRGVLMG